MTEPLALTLWEPWASLVVAGIKRWETRPSPPGGPMCPAGVRPYPGRPLDPGSAFYVHAAARRPDVGRIAGGIVRRSSIGNRWLWTGSGRTGREVELELASGLLLGATRVGLAAPIRNAADWVDPTDVDEPVLLHDEATDDEPELVALIEPGDFDRGYLQTDLHRADVAAGDWRAGRWGWRLDATWRFADPIFCTGHQGLWTVRDSARARAAAQGMERTR